MSMRSQRFRVRGIWQLQIVERRGANFEPNHLCQRIGRRKEASNRGGGIQRQRGSSTSDSMCVSHSTLVQQMKHSCAHPFLWLEKYYFQDQGRPSNQYPWREEVMKNMEKLKALEVEKEQTKMEVYRMDLLYIWLQYAICISVLKK
jgi:hypothetical protein